MDDLSAAVRAVEVHPETLDHTRRLLFSVLQQHGIDANTASLLLDKWLIKGDFLLVSLGQTFTHVVGNPPYVRQEQIPDQLLAEYRRRYRTIYDRADLYVPFIERCLTTLSPAGTLGFICSDRWTKNKYGGPLRAMVAKGFHLACYIDMVDTPAFHAEVVAYPAITIITRDTARATRVVRRPAIEPSELSNLAHRLRADAVALDDTAITEVDSVTQGSQPWILHAFTHLEVVRRLEADFPLIEDTGCAVGIGVATGADRVFIAPFDQLDVEADRKLRLITTKDIESGTVHWNGHGIINPFNEQGALVNLAVYPRLAQFFTEHEAILRRRNCAQKNPRAWYRTIDRIYPALLSRPKLLIPDIKGEAHVVYEDGQYYPHHNLYYIVAEAWDLHALQAVLLSGIARLFVATYSTAMRGGYLRFQAQYLRRIRLPHWRDVPSTVRQELAMAATMRDRTACNNAVAELYQLSPSERAVVFERNL
ncbi:MAG: Modification methylase PaeR7I [bacterium ADurb.Bin429]|nr:MAG: Modification methylase PaeR7I [bacterium ADurb.Bin429]